MGIDRRDDRSLLILALFVWCGLWARAALVPLVHDECASLYWYAEPASFLPPAAHPDANNHLLGSALGALFVHLFGTSALTARLSSLLAFPLYAWCVRRLGLTLRVRIVRWCAWSALLGCPFLLEFFALFRGYGLELAFLALALDGLFQWVRDRSNWALMRLLVGLLLANAAVLVLVPLWGCVLALLLPAVLRADVRRRLLPLWTLLGALPFALAAAISLDLHGRGLLYHGSDAGLLPVTVGSLVRLVFGADGLLPRLAALLPVFAAAVVVARRRAWNTPLALATGMLLLDAGMRVALSAMLGINHAEDRAALHLVPPWCLVVAHLVEVAAAWRPPLRWLALLLLFMPLRTLATWDLDHTALWAEQSVPDRFLARIAREQERTARPAIVGAYHQAGFSIPVNGRAWGVPEPHTAGFPGGVHDLRIADGRHLSAARNGYIVEDVHAGTGLHLLRRARPLELRPVDSLVVDPPLRPRTFFDLVAVPAAEGACAVEVDCTIRSAGPLQDLVLAVVAQDSAGHELAHEEVRPALLRGRWHGERFTALRVLRPVPGAVRHVLYFWNAQRRPVQFGPVRIRIHRIPN